MEKINKGKAQKLDLDRTIRLVSGANLNESHQLGEAG